MKTSSDYGTRAVRFKTQRPQYKAFCYGRALFYLQNKPARSGNGLLNRLAADGGWGSRPLFCAIHNMVAGSSNRKDARYKGSSPLRVAMLCVLYAA